MYQAGTGQLLGRDFYVNDKIGRMEGYRGVARDANERGVGEVQIKYRPLTAEEATDHEIEAGDTAVVCEVYQLRAWNLAQRMGQRYEPISGVGVIRKVEKYDKKSTQKWDDNARRYVQLPESGWRLQTLEGGMTWRKKAQNRAYKDALRHTPGMPASPEEVIADAAMTLDELPPEAARLDMAQAMAWVAEHGAKSDDEPDGVTDGQFTEQPKPAPVANSQQAQEVATFRNTSRPWPANMAIDAIRSQAGIDDGKPVDEGLWGALVGTLDSAPFNTQMRHELVDQIFQVQTTKDLNPAQRKAMIKWSKVAKSGSEKSDPWVMDGNALTEYKAIVGSLWIEQPATTDKDEAWAAIDAAGVPAADAPQF
jgi:hypothetical protein